MSVLFACMSVFCMHAWYLQRPEVGIGSGTVVADDCEVPCGCWDLHLGPLEEQQCS